MPSGIALLYLETQVALRRFGDTWVRWAGDTAANMTEARPQQQCLWCLTCDVCPGAEPPRQPRQPRERNGERADAVKTRHQVAQLSN